MSQSSVLNLENKGHATVHASYMGIIRMKRLARNYFSWPNLGEDIERITGSCEIYLEFRRNTAETPLTPWQWPSITRSRIHTDFLGPSHGCMFLLIIDAHSKWPELFNMKSNTQSDNLIKAFKNVFSRYGLGDHVVRNNGSQYKSEIRASGPSTDASSSISYYRT